MMHRSPFLAFVSLPPFQYVAHQRAELFDIEVATSSGLSDCNIRFRKLIKWRKVLLTVTKSSHSQYTVYHTLA